MQPERTEVKAFTVAGLQTRTTNAQEMNPLAAQIPGLWGRFMSEAVYNKLAPHASDACVYGVYDQFESDATGAYSLTAGRAVSALASDGAPECKSAQVQSGTYLVFAAPGPRPQVVVSTWMAIWQYFQQHPEIKRAYQSDFERYDGTDGIAIYIGIHP